MPKIVLTGGGTAGHVMANVALLPELRSKGWQPYYIGSKSLERSIIEPLKVPFFAIQSGKLRRYFSWKNVSDLFRIFYGFLQALFLLSKLRPVLVFSKGGFVAVPVVWAAWIMRIPVIIHEADVTPGLANRLSLPFAKQAFYAFEATRKHLPKEKSTWVGLPIRQELLWGQKAKGLKFCQFPENPEKTLLVMGGSQGSHSINLMLEKTLPRLLSSGWHIIHLTGKGKTNDFKHSCYRSFAFLHEDLPDVLAAADIVISRAGANAIFELLALKKPMLLIPLSQGSRGDQIINARDFKSRGWASVLEERDLSEKTFLHAVDELARNAVSMTSAQSQGSTMACNQKIVESFNRFLS